ncbi:hypothetical protein ACU4GD_10210 [Cupriavidus basilensis]
MPANLPPPRRSAVPRGAALRPALAAPRATARRRLHAIALAVALLAAPCPLLHNRTMVCKSGTVPRCPRSWWWRRLRCPASAWTAISCPYTVRTASGDELNGTRTGTLAEYLGAQLHRRQRQRHPGQPLPDRPHLPRLSRLVDPGCIAGAVCLPGRHPRQRALRRCGELGHDSRSPPWKASRWSPAPTPLMASTRSAARLP